MSSNSRLILVTGGTGYIGSHTVVALQEKGYKVVIIDNLTNSRIEVLDGIENITGIKPLFRNFNLCDKKALDAFCREFPKINAIIHFAASKAVGESVEIPLEYYHNNIESLVNLLMCMRDFNINHFVFSSSCTVYGQPDKLPVTEHAPVKKAISPYGNTKQISEEIIQDAIMAIKNIQAISLRYFNPIGAHETAHIGELPLGDPLNLVPIITQTVAGVRTKLKVYGNDYNTPDGTPIRDYINVNDLAMAHVAAVDRMVGGKNEKRYEVFNLGTGIGLTVMEIIKTFEKVTGEKVDYEIVGRRPGDVERVWADTSLANEKLGWKAATSLEDTLKSAWKWEKIIRNIK